jgi:hypothetical protein
MAHMVVELVKCDLLNHGICCVSLVLNAVHPFQVDWDTANALAVRTGDSALAIAKSG